MRSCRLPPSPKDSPRPSRRQSTWPCLDVLLPDGDGIALFRKIRAIDNTLPVIFVTASGSSNTAIEAMQLGALDYLVKPLQVAEVRRVVQRALEVRRMADGTDHDGPGADSGDEQ